LQFDYSAFGWGVSSISAAAGRTRTSLLEDFIVPINQARILSDGRSSDLQMVIRRWLRVHQTVLDPSPQADQTAAHLRSQLGQP